VFSSACGDRIHRTGAGGKVGGASIDFGDIFNVNTTTPDLTFEWQTQTTGGANNGPDYPGSGIEYVGGSATPEPGTLGMLGLGGVMMMRRRRTQRRKVAGATGRIG
jgi:hypothetical protein